MCAFFPIIGIRDFYVRLLIIETNLKMFFFGSDAASSHTTSHPQHLLIDNRFNIISSRKTLNYVNLQRNKSLNVSTRGEEVNVIEN